MPPNATVMQENVASPMTGSRAVSPGKPLEEAFHATKAIQGYAYTGAMAVKSEERRFARRRDGFGEAGIYAPMSRGFYIPIPAGRYSPDLAIAFYEGQVRHSYFSAAAKGAMDRLAFRLKRHRRVESSPARECATMGDKGKRPAAEAGHRR